MMTNHEPCPCGALDCPECYPATWRDPDGQHADVESDPVIDTVEMQDDVFRQVFGYERVTIRNKETS